MRPIGVYQSVMDNALISASLQAIRRILRAAELGERKLAQAVGLTPSQVVVLQEVDRIGDVIPSEVASALQLSQASITNIVDRLEELGLVTRRRGERDKRQVRLTATGEGVRVLAGSPDLLQNRIADRFKRLATWEQASLLSSLHRLADLLDVEEPGDALIDADVPRAAIAAEHARTIA